ncbi:aldo/keto reductase [Rhizophagus clarus]|uniref:Aldo/keto reductase n=1 Tax=Rhizophagus clarus TaxID=94130 RepID=A0A8H3M7R6_9GLOM|nr:aldo/keto reductase [Rhizophagus clarus]
MIPACVYDFGRNERFLGDFVSDKRSEVVVATKYTCNTAAVLESDKRFNPNFGENYRKSVVENLNESLKRLNMSYVDILYVYFYEYRTPIEEIMRSLDNVVRSGKVLYVGISDTPYWALTRANTIAELRGWSPFIGLQSHYNLLDRSLEFDLQPACVELDVVIIPWSIVADGFITGRRTNESIADITDYRTQTIANYSKYEQNWKVLNEVFDISKEIDGSPLQVALNLTRQKPGITSPLINAKNLTQLEENLKSLEFKLSPEQMRKLDHVSQSTGREVPFPYSITNILDGYIGKNIQVPNKFASIMTTTNKYGRLC